MEQASDEHRRLILDQFTRQAVPFSQMRDHSPGLILAAAEVRPDDTVLDVACGPGLVVCAFARVARHVTGIDLTPAMIERARGIQRERGLRNVTFEVGDVRALPHPDASFTIVASRFAFHHIPEPAAVLAEMKRVCTPGGKVLVTDVEASPDPAKAAAFNRMERLRDPSHVRALPLAELLALFSAVELPAPRTTAYDLRSELEGLLGRSFP